MSIYYHSVFCMIYLDLYMFLIVTSILHDSCMIVVGVLAMTDF